ncbi:MAG: Response regulator, LuxR family [Verrucomicrobia bacterium]|nr:Response regulator, LuxR family [Verrucomicrobiota bacterium]
MTRILITDDHVILRRGLKQILAGEIAGAVFGEADDSAEALLLLGLSTWDILILDINLPGRNGFEVLDEVRRSHPLLPVLVLSSTPEDQLGLRAIKGGAAGYLNKQTAPELLVEAVQKILAGEQFMSPLLAHKLVADLRRDTRRARHEMLSDRELQVLKLIVAGQSQKEIAADLSLSAKTISTFRSRLLEKLGVRNDVELARYAQEHGIS